MQQQNAVDIPVCPGTHTKLYVKRHLLLAKGPVYCVVSMGFILRTIQQQLFLLIQCTE